MRNLFRRTERGGTAQAEPATPEEPAEAEKRPLTEEELDALLPRAQFERAAAEYRGHFEGLWTDRVDADAVVDRRLRAGQITDADAELLRFWIEHGYVVIPGAVSQEVCDQLQDDLSQAFANGDDRAP